MLSNAHSSDSALDKATVPVLDIRSSGEIDQLDTEDGMCFSSSLGHQPSQHQSIPSRVSRSSSGHSVSMQVNVR